MTEQIAQEVPFEEDEIPVYRVPTEETREGMLVVTLDAYEGPLDLLLDLARDQKVDLVHISILRLVEQYVAFIEEAKKIEIVVAADYLLMASWLTFLKSKLLQLGGGFSAVLLSEEPPPPSLSSPKLQ